jgi:hypothetical protein
MTEQPISNITLHDSRYKFGEQVIRIDKEGFHYKGQFIADAGEAHRLMVEFIRQQTQFEPQGPTLDDVSELCEEFGFHLDESYDNLESADALREMFRAVLARWGNR